jgi:hypothetical protein
MQAIVIRTHSCHQAENKNSLVKIAFPVLLVKMSDALAVAHVLCARSAV